jgi:hypothetical protein
MRKRKLNPASLQNLKPGESTGRKRIHDSVKRGRSVTATDEGWQGFQELAKSFGYSASEFVDQLGRGNLAVLESDTIESLQDALDLADARAAIAEAKEKGTKSLEQVIAEMSVNSKS